jgi:L-fuculose-phosphate aldolase
MNTESGENSGAGPKNIPAPDIIGLVHSELVDLKSCPRWQDDGPEAVLEIFPPYAEALKGMREGQRIEIITWLHLADRTLLLLQDDWQSEKRPERGVFNSRSPARPNPIGVHEVKVIGIDKRQDGVSIRVNALEALNGTPILDIKTGRGNWEPGVSGDLPDEEHEARLKMQILCRRAGARGFFPGLSGNASLRLNEYCLITESGTVKSELDEEDFIRVRIKDGLVMDEGAAPSSETGAHLEIYRKQPGAGAVLHTHPAALLALGLKKPQASLPERLGMPIFEAEILAGRMISLPRLRPGSPELSAAVGRVAPGKNIIWLEGHGLLVWGDSGNEILALSEAVERLAVIALRTGA